MLPQFQAQYPATQAQTVPTGIIGQYQNRLPMEILYLWQTHGWGKYADGLIELVNPADYADNLWEWLGGTKNNYTPFAITAFGELFYHRKLSDEGDEDICLLDIQYQNCEVLDWNTREFFENTLCDETFKEDFLRQSLFVQATRQYGNLKNGEIFLFQPILALGGFSADNTELLKRLGKGNAAVYQTLVFQLINS
ncbi:MAG: GAD-like domain-containing protein [Alysiella sp.]|uniref:GAD-like domain-containing protein n=1 Tax=Alysiella sp. TaxID=1872483 RepID=UPI0026DD4997|nr:GAD-like domain-containing protein [Alysiella sp.]MDO4433425.1 GAD-like domain-containing protein [Alysiella sp.]